VSFQATLVERKRQIEPAPAFWYPYGTMANFEHLERLLHGENRKLLALAGGKPVADIGAADGDLAFFLEQQHGLAVHVIDNAPTNFNGMRGVRRMREALGSSVQIHGIDLDELHELPDESFGLIFFLGILYHLKNPFHALESLARSSRYLLLSTRIAQLSPDRKTSFAHLPMAYLVHETETNNDATNYWIFSDAGLRRIIERAGWEILDYLRVGATEGSDPVSPDRDERAFCLLKSKRA